MKHKAIWREYLEAIAIALVLALFIRGFIVEPYQIPSGSMLDTLLIGDRLLVNKFSYQVRIPIINKVIFRTWEPQHGDIIVFAYPENETLAYIKRIAGVPGDVLEIRNKVLYRNGEAVNEPYVRFENNSGIPQPGDNVRPFKVPEDKYFVMGDNRDKSFDSRFWGFVDRSAIYGKAWRIYWSNGSTAGDAGTSGFSDTDIRWKRIGRLVQ